MSRGNSKIGPALDDGPLSQRLTVPEGLDILLIDPDAQSCLHLARELSDVLPVRAAERGSGREALGSFTRARFDAVITRQWMGDTDCWRWIRMVRSGRFGFAATPVFVLCSEVEHDALVPVLDAHTRLIVEDDLEALRAALSQIRAGVRRQSVLVVEDEPAAALAAVLALHKYYRVGAADSGEGGLAVWRQQRHDLVLLDLRLPGMSGEVVLQELLREEPRQAVIVLTAHDAPEEHRDLMLAGAVDFLSKPVDLHMLPEICARALRHQACLASASRSLSQESEVTELVGRVRAAQYTLERGQAGRAAQHLQHAVFESRTRMLSDDEWARLLGENEED